MLQLCRGFLPFKDLTKALKANIKKNHSVIFNSFMNFNLGNNFSKLWKYLQIDGRS
jgi:hypothetical protein